MARSLASVLAAAAAVTVVQGQLFWGTAHHDIGNTGRSPFESPGDEKAPCWQEAVSSVGTDTYMNTGSVSLDNEFLVLGTADNAVEVIDVNTFSRIKYRLSPEGTWGVPGVVSSPTIYPESLGGHANDTEELVFFGSVFDGNVYALDLEECTKDLPAAGNETVVQAVAPCLKWKTDLGGSVYAPVRATGQGIALEGDTILAFPSTTDPLADAGGMLHGLEVAGGTPHWAHPWNATILVGDTQAAAAAVPAGGADPAPATLTATTSTTGIRSVITVDACNRLLLVPSGPRIAILSAEQGIYFGEFAGDPADPFASAAVLFPNCSHAFVHSRSGALWKLRMDILPTPPFAALELEWKCTYAQANPGDPYVETCTVNPIDVQGAVWVEEEALEEGARDTVHVGRGGTRGAWLYDAAAMEAGAPTAPEDLLPLGTPALGEFDTNLFFPLYSEQDPHGGALLKIDTRSGAPHWAFTGSNMGSANALPFGASRSSPAVDASGDVLVASDSSRGPVPALFAVAHDGTTQWAMDLTTEGGDELNNISPVIMQSPDHVPRVYIATTQNLRVIEEGCPTSNNDLECSGQGTCNCATRTCECRGAADGTACYVGPACNEPLCGGLNTCNAGTCTCFQCTDGPRCENAKTCGAHGVCQPGTNTCDCGPCWSLGPDGSCSVPHSCPNPHDTCDDNIGCVCDLCFAGSTACDQNTTCSGHGWCKGGGHGCQCDSGFFPSNDRRGCNACPFCLVGPNCLLENQCAGHGTCDNDAAVCHCEDGYSGVYCTDPPSSGKGTGPSGAPPSPGGVVVAVLFALVAVGGIAFIIYARLRFPGRAYADACIGPLQPCCRACPSARSVEQSCLGLCRKKPGALSGQAATSAAVTTSKGGGYGTVATSVPPATSSGASAGTYSSL